MEVFAPDLLDSIKNLPAQLTDAWRQVSELDISRLVGPEYHSIAVAGMGGSTLGADFIRHAFKDSLRLPLEIINDYKLPAWVDHRTLVVLSSYSGTTEETLACNEDAKKRGCSVFIMAAGGRLLEGAQTLDWPHWKIEDRENPSRQPRMAIGYMVAGLACLLSRLDLIDASDRRFESAGTFLKSHNKKLSAPKNPAEELANYAEGRFLLLMSAEHLVGAAHVVNNQMNENAKHLSVTQSLPELDHHFLEGLGFPRLAKHHAMAVLFQSELYHSRTRRRVELTATILEENGIPSAVIDVYGPNRLTQALNAVQFGSYVSYYLAKNHRIDPVPVPNVDYLKRMLRGSPVLD